MRILVCIKQVPATEATLRIASSGTDIDRTALSYVVNPYDEFAIEEALRIKERTGDIEVIVLSIRTHSEQRPEEALRSCLAMGADRAVLLRDQAFEGCDSLATAGILAATAQRLPADLILCGKQAVDDDQEAVGIQLAELLHLPHVGVVERLEIDPTLRLAVADRQIEGAIEVVEVALPAVITCQKGLNEPRYPSLAGIMQAKRKPFDVWGSAEIGLLPEELEARVLTLRLESPPSRPQGQMLPGDARTMVRELVRRLHEEEKVI